MFERVFRGSKQKPGQAVQKYNRLMAEGLAKQKDCSVTVVSEMPITEENYEKKDFSGIPTEYNHHLYFIEEDSAEGIKVALMSTLDRSQEELSLKGMEAKRFVLNEKNNIVQTEKNLHLFDITT